MHARYRVPDRKAFLEHRTIPFCAKTMTAGTKVLANRTVGSLPRYRVAMFAYSDHVYDLLDGVKPVDYVASLGIPQVSPVGATNTARGFIQVEKLLLAELPNLEFCPAPLVCHMTDGEYTGEDPEPVVRRIMDMRNSDGHVLVENIFISDQVLPEPIFDPHYWPGITPRSNLLSDYANKLRTISSALPKGYQIMMQEAGYQLSSDSVMMLPGMSPDLVEMGFVMSTATPVAR